MPATAFAQVVAASVRPPPPPPPSSSGRLAHRPPLPPCWANAGVSSSGVDERLSGDSTTVVAVATAAATAATSGIYTYIHTHTYTMIVYFFVMFLVSVRRSTSSIWFWVFCFVFFCFNKFSARFYAASVVSANHITVLEFCAVSMKLRPLANWYTSKSLVASSTSTCRKLS